MYPRSPVASLDGLRAFEAVARHGSLTRAVTHSAIGHQISVLEVDHEWWFDPSRASDFRQTKLSDA